jgi:hypothetical protein
MNFVDIAIFAIYLIGIVLFGSIYYKKLTCRI